MALVISACFLVVLAVTELPKIPLILLAASCAGIAYFVDKQRTEAVVAEKKKEKSRAPEPEVMPVAARVDPLEIEVGYGLIRLVDRTQGGDLKERVQAIRRQIVDEMGLVIPPIRIRDNTVSLGANAYTIKVRGVPVASGEAYAEHFLAMDSGLATGKLQGIKTREPAFGLDATWITASQRSSAENMGYTVVDPASVIATHLTETIKAHCEDILTRQKVQEILDRVKETSPALVEDLVPTLLRVGDVQKVLQNLLHERVPIKDVETILEALGDYAPRTKDAEILTEYARNALSRWIANQYAADGKVHVVTVDPALEDRIGAAIEHSDAGSYLTLPPEAARAISSAATKELEKLLNAGHMPVVLTSPQIRAQLRRLLEQVLPSVAVIAYNEISREVVVESLGMITVNE
jgi:flagellar biosynthesis protein FlhA